MTPTDKLIAAFEAARSASRANRGDPQLIAASDRAWAALKAQITQIEDALIGALPYVEDCIDSPDFKRGHVKKEAAAIRALIETA